MRMNNWQPVNAFLLLGSPDISALLNRAQEGIPHREWEDIVENDLPEEGERIWLIAENGDCLSVYVDVIDCQPDGEGWGEGIDIQLFEIHS